MFFVYHVQSLAFPASSLSSRDNLLCCTGSQKEGQLKEGLRLSGIVLYAGGEFFFVYRVSITSGKL